MLGEGVVRSRGRDDSLGKRVVLRVVAFREREREN